MIDVAIVGGGPVGLYLACLLLQAGVSVRVLEQKVHRSAHSRAIGIHPPALEALNRVGCADEMIKRGVSIGEGLAFCDGRQLAAVRFSDLASRYPFVLSSPQAVTETVLEERLTALDASALQRGTQVTSFVERGNEMEIGFVSEDTEDRLSARWCVLANGAGARLEPAPLFGQTRVRSREYRDAYIMGDFVDATGFGSTAVLFLEREGLVESFPLPENIRRWVARVDDHDPLRTADWLADVVNHRTRAEPDPGTCTMISSFRVRSSRVPRMIVGRTAVIGDAAHEVSPIGGQGMNLGWLDAAELAPILKLAVAGGCVSGAVRSFESSRARAAKRGAVQAEINMMLGRPPTAAARGLRNLLISGASSTPAINKFAARRFTMQ